MFILALMLSSMIATGQVLWKMGLHNKKEIFSQGIFKLSLYRSIISSPYIIIGVVIYAGATILWLYLLSRYDLSKVYPILSIAFIIVLFAARFLLQEKVSLTQWLGTIIIVSGIYLITRP